MTQEIQAQIEMREAEVASYEANIAMFKAMLATLPRDWPPHLLQFKDAPNHHEAIAKVENLNDVEFVSALWHADICNARIRSEMVEMQKSKGILNYLKASI